MSMPQGPLRLSKTIRSGDFVIQSGGKFIRSGRRTRKPFGVYQDQRQYQIFTDAGWQYISVPRGIVTRGHIEMKETL